MVKLRRIARLCGLLLPFLAIPGTARAQVSSGDFFTEPLLILNGSGHSAPVRSMVFTPDSSQLLTGGMDKVIQVWNLGTGRAEYLRTLRPPNWRASRGQVNALALSPRVVGNQRVLAVAGSGVLANRGEILLFDYPGTTGQGTGDIKGQLSASAALPGQPARPGHLEVVTSMAFTPDGRFLASASNDKTVRIWDVDGRRQLAVLDQATQPVNSLAIFDNGRKLASGGRDGLLRIYDIANPARPRLLGSAPPNPPNPLDTLGGMINTLAVSPDGRWIVVGNEGGWLIRHDASTLAPARLTPANIRNGPVEALAISPDGKFLATSTVTRNLANPTEFPTFSCLVEIRSMPGGQVLETLPVQKNLIRSLAFSPDGGRLAYSGGDSQSVFLKTLAVNGLPPRAGNGLPPEESPGPGSSLWDVGFRSDGQAIRFARTRPDVPGQASEYESYHLRKRGFYDPEPGEPGFRHAVASGSGWTIRPVNLTRLDFVNAQGQGWPGDLDPLIDVRWFSYTIIPPNPAAGHTDPVAAVGCESGVVLWNLATGKKTRFFNGHSGPVYSMASSDDGKWLVTGSSDQTARIWALAGCDRLPAFGARFRPRPDGAWVVAEVTPGGFAEGIKLREGHVIESFYVGDKLQLKEQTAAILPNLDAQPATVNFSFFARMGADRDQLKALASKRDSPSLTLFPATGREWVLWTPRGYYDTSVEGDRKYLGWLTNQGSFTQLLAGQFDPIGTFEGKYRQPRLPNPNVLDRLLDTGDPIVALAAIPPAARAEAGPVDSRFEKLEFFAGRPADGPAPVPGAPILAKGGQVAFEYVLKVAADAARIARGTIFVNGKPVGPLPVVGPDRSSAAGPVVVPIPVGPASVVTLEVEDDRKITRRVDVTVRNPDPPAPDRRRSRLEILTIGAETFEDKRLTTIPHARQDARDLAKFLKERMIDPATGVRFAQDRVFDRNFVEPREVLSVPLTRAIDDLKNAEGDARLIANDAVAVVIESHFLSPNSSPKFATSEQGQGPFPASISAADLADRLAELTGRGCRVVVLLDVVHRLEARNWEDDMEIKEWIRQLQSRCHVATFVASSHGPSEPRKPDPNDARTNRAFAEGVLKVLKAGGSSRLGKPGAGPMTFSDFDRSVREVVLENTRRKQHAVGYLPETIPAEFPFLDTTELPGPLRAGTSPDAPRR